MGVKFISLFAGVGGFDLGMERAGHTCVGQVEWDKNAAGVLKRRWPDVPLFCDVSKVSADDLPDADFITYGFPCVDLSVAGKREGLDGERSNLFFQAIRLLNELRKQDRLPRFSIAENVVGLLSANNRGALPRCLQALTEVGAVETCWRVVDSRFFGVPQRRRRVFLVSDFGGEAAAKALSFGEGKAGNTPAGRKKGEEVTPFTPSSIGGYSEGVGTLRANGGDLGGGSETLVVRAADIYNGTVTGDTTVTVTSATGISNATGPKIISWNGDTTPKCSEDVCMTLRAQQGGEGIGVTDGLTIRKLSVKETERLQGFPDDWTSERAELVLEGNEWKATGKVVKQADGPRYKQMGNAVTVNVAEWLGRRLDGAF